MSYINSDIKLKSIFNHSLKKYKIKFLLEYVIKILYSCLSCGCINRDKNAVDNMINDH